MPDDLSYCAQEVRRLDWDRFICAVFAPADRREALFALLALDLELAKSRHVVSEPLLGEIRLQWWREAIDNIYDAPDQVPIGNPILAALKTTIIDWRLPRQQVSGMIAGYVVDNWTDVPAGPEVVIEFAQATSGNLGYLFLHILSTDGIAEDHPAMIAAVTAAAAVGVAWGVSVYLRSERAPAHMKDGLSKIVADKLGEARALRSDIDRRYLPALLPATMIEAADGGRSGGRLRKQLSVWFNAARGGF